MSARRVRLTAGELATIGRLVELDLRGDVIDLVAVQRVLEHGARQGSPLYTIAAWGSDAQARRIVREALAVREDRELTERIIKS